MKTQLLFPMRPFAMSLLTFGCLSAMLLSSPRANAESWAEEANGRQTQEIARKFNEDMANLEREYAAARSVLANAKLPSQIERDRASRLENKIETTRQEFMRREPVAYQYVINQNAAKKSAARTEGYRQMDQARRAQVEAEKPVRARQEQAARSKQAQEGVNSDRDERFAKTRKEQEEVGKHEQRISAAQAELDSARLRARRNTDPTAVANIQAAQKKLDSAQADFHREKPAAAKASDDRARLHEASVHAAAVKEHEQRISAAQAELDSARLRARRNTDPTAVANIQAAQKKLDSAQDDFRRNEPAAAKAAEENERFKAGQSGVAADRAERFAETRKRQEHEQRISAAQAELDSARLRARRNTDPTAVTNVQAAQKKLDSAQADFRRDQPVAAAAADERVRLNEANARAAAEKAADKKTIEAGANVTGAERRIEQARKDLLNASDADDRRQANKDLDQAQKDLETAKKKFASQDPAALGRLQEVAAKNAGTRVTQAEERVAQARKELLKASDADDRKLANDNLGKAQAELDSLRMAKDPEAFARMTAEKHDKEVDASVARMDAAKKKVADANQELKQAGTDAERVHAAAKKLSSAKRELESARLNHLAMDPEALDRQHASEVADAKDRVATAEQEVAAAKKKLATGDADDRKEANAELSAAQEKLRIAKQETAAPVSAEDKGAKATVPAASNKSRAEIEQEGMKKLADAQKEADDMAPRCFYSGFAAKDGEKCTPVRSTEEAKALGVDLNGVAPTFCGEGMVMCQPLAYGVTSEGKAHCVRAYVDASKDCGTASILGRNSEANKAYQALMADPENKADRDKLMKQVARACSKDQQSIDRFFTKNIKNRKSKEDHERTCEILSKSLEVAKGVVPMEEPAPGVPAPTADPRDAAAEQEAVQ